MVLSAKTAPGYAPVIRKVPLLYFYTEVMSVLYK